MDEEILGDFLVEAGELIEELGDKLMQLEAAPDDPELINAVFRAFHTVKGGAGFLNLEPVVRLCHAGEEVCTAVRSGKLALRTEMVDHISAAVDVVQRQLADVGDGKPPAAAPDELLAALAACLAPPKPPARKKSSARKTPARGARKTPARKSAKARTPEPAADEPIGDDEFEALLDSLHGSGAPPGAAAEAPPNAPVTADTPAAADKAPATRLPTAAAPKAPAEATVRVDTRRLDKVLNLVGELVLVRNRLKLAAPRGSEAQPSVGQLDQITSALQSAVMQMRMQPIRKVFSRFPKQVRDMARSLEKEVTVELSGEDTELDRNLVEALADPLVHMVRNAVDHGIEGPDEREARGKPRRGTLWLNARQEGDSIVITIRDDGGGIDPNLLRTKAVDKGVISREEAARMDARECFQILFMPGFSTRDQVSDLSGRGVGMDVVKTRINALNGQVEIESEPGVGSAFEIRVPLTLAILPTLMVTAGGRIFAVPLSVVSDVILFEQSARRVLDRREVLQVRGEALPLLDLCQWADAGREGAAEAQHVVIVRAGNEDFALLVDSVRGREEVVIKPLGRMLQSLAGFAGATVTGEGEIALILDMAGLLKVFPLRPTHQVTPPTE